MALEKRVILDAAAVGRLCKERDELIQTVERLRSERGAAREERVQALRERDRACQERDDTPAEDRYSRPSSKARRPES